MSLGERSKTNGTTMSIQGKVGPNKAARQSLADRLTTEQSSFDASAGLLSVQVEKKNPKDKKEIMLSLLRARGDSMDIT